MLKKLNMRKHSLTLRYFFAGVSGVIDFPEFTAVGLVDDEQFMYFDSNIKKAVPKTEWIRQNEGADYWDRQTQPLIGSHQTFKNNIQVLKEWFNQSAGLHTLQRMYGCEFDDQTGATNAFKQYGYDGEDFVSLDWKELRYISTVQQGIQTAQNWNNKRGFLENDRNYYSTICIEWLKKYLQYGKSRLQKTGMSECACFRKCSKFFLF
uniref:MHC class I-like antigen recognition-like domain-containing protein n=1 Tax=Sinocyclocheilus rhinocerous TaxID=307959 RepID=A0A673N4T0_9TELE